MFADDFKLMFPVTSDGDALQAQRDIDILAADSTSWGLTLNISKCNVLQFNSNNTQTYSIGSNILSSVSESRDLGVTVDTALKFHSHVTTITKRAAGLAHNLLK